MIYSTDLGIKLFDSVFLCLKPSYCLIRKQLQMPLPSKCNKLLFIICSSLPFLNIWFMLRGAVIYISYKIIIKFYYIMS